VFAQLRYVLAAKDSAVVAQENHDGGSFVPQGAEPRLMTIAIGKRDKGELIAEGRFHATSILCSRQSTVKRRASALVHEFRWALHHWFQGLATGYSLIAHTGAASSCLGSEFKLP
jgi:hypothetical protein